MRLSAAVLPLILACSPHAVTPGSRTLVVDNPATLDPGHSDAQVDVASIGQLWGPELVAGNGRMRTAVSDQVVLEGEAGILRVTNAGSGGDRNAYTGRLGALFRSEDHGAALTVGAGGGTSAVAGNWGAVDAGGVLAGGHRWVRPVLAVDLGYAAPLDSGRTFSVTDTDGTSTELRLPRNVILKINLGLELGDRRSCLVLGAAMVKFWRSESSVVGSTTEQSDEGFVAVGVGLRLALD